MFHRICICALAVASILPLVTDPCPSYAGRVQGPGISTSRCEAGGSVTYHDKFRAGQRAVITVDGDGDTDLDVYVYDENGNLVASDEDYTDTCVVSFTPSWTGVFQIVVRNRGSVYNHYTIETN